MNKFEDHTDFDEHDPLKTYEVTIKAEIYKTITVEATDEDTAYNLAHELFTVTHDEWPEKYDEQTMNIKLVKQEIT